MAAVVKSCLVLFMDLFSFQQLLNRLLLCVVAVVLLFLLSDLDSVILTTALNGLLRLGLVSVPVDVGIVAVLGPLVKILGPDALPGGSQRDCLEGLGGGRRLPLVVVVLVTGHACKAAVVGVAYCYLHYPVWVYENAFGVAHHGFCAGAQDVWVIYC